MNGANWKIIVVVMLLLVSGGGTWLLMKNHEATSKSRDDRESFLTLLRASGIQVEKATGTNSYATFMVPKNAELGIWTNQGFMDVFFFPTEIEDSFTVNKVGDYSWKLSGLNQPVEWNSNRTWYFMAHRNIVIATDSQELSKTLGGLRKN